MTPLLPLLDRHFQITKRGSTPAREARGAVATFLTMAYILFANPAILAAAGVPKGSAVACTAAAAGLSCLLMGFVANFPLALASGMGLNAVVAFQVAKAAGSWQTAMGLVVLDGIVILLLVLSGLREGVLKAIPADLRRAIGVGIGLFIAFIGLVNAGIVVAGPAGGPPVTYGSLANKGTLVAVVGLAVMGALMARKVTGALLIGIASATLLAFALGVTHWPGALAPPSLEAAFKANVWDALRADLLPLLLAIVLVDFFDTLGTASAIADQAGLRDGNGEIPRLRPILVVDSLAASIGGLFGASSVTSYIESAAGVAEGARTGLHTVLVGLMFLGAILLAPFAGIVPAQATAPALILVGFLMIAQVTSIDWEHVDTAIPAFVTLVTIPMTYSISHGIGYGFAAYVLIKLLTGRWREIHPLLAGATLAFAAYFAWGKG